MNVANLILFLCGKSDASLFLLPPSTGPMYQSLLPLGHSPLANILSSSSSIGGGAKVGHRREKERSPKIGGENHLRVCFSYEEEEENSEASINLPISLPELRRGFILKGLEHFSRVS